MCGAWLDTIAVGDITPKSHTESLFLMSALIATASTKCPLCLSRARREIDWLIAEIAPHLSEHEQVVDEQGEIVLPERVSSYSEVEKAVRELLEKLQDSSTSDFGIVDVILHASRHVLVAEMQGQPLRSEGDMLFWGENAYKRIDLKDALDVAILIGLEQMRSGEMKMSHAAWVNMIVAKWRMSGSSGDDPFIQAMLERTQKAKTANPDSPLGAAYLERQEKLERQRQAQAEYKTDGGDVADRESS